MRHEPDIASVAALLGERARAEMCLALCGGRALPAGELARRAGISAQTASNHLAKLVRGGLVRVEQQGRWRYMRLAGPEVASAVEALALIAPANGRPPDSPCDEAADVAMREARTCYRHLAGRLGVAVTDALVRERWLVDPSEYTRHFDVTQTGAEQLGRLGIAVRELRKPKRSALARKCLDWTERRHHLAGPLATALLDLFLGRDWLRPITGTRAVSLTPAGRAALRELLNVGKLNGHPHTRN
jgi:DNA-binding transcriptional ArsR family regulator